MESKTKSIIFLVIVGNKVCTKRLWAYVYKIIKILKWSIVLKATMSILYFIYLMDLKIIWFMKHSYL